MLSVLGAKLVGLYLDGSLVTGDFDEGVSDVDLTAVLADELDEREYGELGRMHASFAKDYVEWSDRIEVCYVSVDALAAVRSRRSEVVNVSPGEPFHRTVSRPERILSWYLVREVSLPLHGPPARDLIEPITRQEHILSIRAKARELRRWLEDGGGAKGQAFAVLTQCRCMCSCRFGEQTSKKRAASWAADELPEWRALIEQALAWRLDTDDGELGQCGTLTERLSLADAVLELLTAGESSGPRSSRQQAPLEGNTW